MDNWVFLENIIENSMQMVYFIEGQMSSYMGSKLTGPDGHIGPFLENIISTLKTQNGTSKIFFLRNVLPDQLVIHTF